MATPRSTALIRSTLGLFLAAAVSGCAGDDGPSVEVPDRYLGTKAERDRAKYGSAVSDNDEGFVLFSSRRGNGRDGDEGGEAGIGVNGYLWRASLETLDFMPLASADPFGGTIITDWYAPAETPEERFKLNAYILGRDLRADGLRVTVFRQVRQDGAWVDAPVDPETATSIEDRILTRARELRIASLDES